MILSTNSTGKPDLNTVESGNSFDNLMTNLSPNSSKLPLIDGKDPNTYKRNLDMSEEDDDVSKLFSFLQILTATFGSFAHGGNDVRFVFIFFLMFYSF